MKREQPERPKVVDHNEADERWRAAYLWCLAYDSIAHHVAHTDRWSRHGVSQPEGGDGERGPILHMCLQKSLFCVPHYGGEPDELALIVQQISVLPSMQRKGVARGALRELEQCAAAEQRGVMVQCVTSGRLRSILCKAGYVDQKDGNWYKARANLTQYTQ